MDIQYTNQFTAIFIAHLLAVMSPGQDFALISRQAFIFGRNVAAFSSLGIAFGILFHISYCILGINIFLSSHDYLYKIFKYLCSIYLFYLGIISYFNKNTSIQTLNEHDNNKKYGYFTAFKVGFITNILNVKASLFFISLYALIDIETPKIIQFFYGLWMAIITGVWFTLVTLFLTNKGFSKYSKKYSRLINKTMAIILIYIAIKIFLN